MSVTSGTKRKEGGIAETIRVVIHALIIALVIRTFLFQPFNIPSGSMKATLLVGDYLFVSKYTYGYSHFSLPLSPPLFSGRIPGDWLPQRGDVVVFRLPKDTDVDYIKRVIGLPGDRIRIDRGQVYVNGQALAEDYVEPDYRDDVSKSEIVVEPDEYYVLGDHRNSSSDSRVWGTVKRKFIYGKAVFCYWPLNKMGRLR